MNSLVLALHSLKFIASPSNACVIMDETTMAMADPAPAERSKPVGRRFNPTDQELVDHYLRHKLGADDLSINDTFPEIGACKFEPWDLLARATSASAIKFDKSQCYFFSPLDYKYKNSKRSNRTTFRGFWKVTGRDRKIKSKDTNKVIGIKKTLVYHEGRVASAVKTNWFIHEYHDAQLSDKERSHVLCWLRKDMEKKTNSTLIVDSMVQTSFQPKEASTPIIQTPFQQKKTSTPIIQTPFQPKETSTPIIQTSFQQEKTSFQPKEASTPIIQTSFQPKEASTPITQTSFQQEKTSTPIIQTASYEPNSTIVVDSPIKPDGVKTSFDIDELDFGSFDLDELASLLQSPRMDEQGQFEIMATSDILCHEA